MPQSVKRIGSLAFCGCEKLEEIVLPEGLQEISNDVFKGNMCLKRIVLPKGVKSIGSSAFYCCEKLEEIELPEGLEDIGTQAFSQCRSLKRIVIPNSVRRIGGMAFSQCEELTTVIMPDKRPDIVWHSDEKKWKDKFYINKGYCENRIPSCFLLCDKIKDIHGHNTKYPPYLADDSFYEELFYMTFNPFGKREGL